MAEAFVLELGENRTIRGDLFLAGSGSKGTIIVMHGYKGFKDWGMFPYLGQALSAEYDVVAFNFSHNGVGESLTEFEELEKFACNTCSLEQDDLDAVVHAVRSGALPGVSGQPRIRPLYLLGHSKGGGAALLYALDHPEEVEGVISWNGVTNLDLLSEEEKQAMRTNGRAYVLNGRTKQMMPLDRAILDDLEANQTRYDLIGRAGELRVPVVLIQGEDDFERLRRGSARLVEARPDIAWHLVPGGNHTFGSVHPFQGETEPLREAVRLTLLWLEDQREDD